MVLKFKVIRKKCGWSKVKIQAFYFLSLGSDRLLFSSWEFYSYLQFLDCSLPSCKYHEVDKSVQGSFNLGTEESYQAEMSLPFVAASPYVCQGHPGGLLPIGLILI